MYYDDIFMEDMEPATRVSEYGAKILEFCAQDPYLSKEIEKERERFLTSKYFTKETMGVEKGLEDR